MAAHAKRARLAGGRKLEGSSAAGMLQRVFALELRYQITGGKQDAARPLVEFPLSRISRISTGTAKFPLLPLVLAHQHQEALQEPPPYSFTVAPQLSLALLTPHRLVAGQFIPAARAV